MFYKIGFWILLVIVIAFIWMFMRTNPMKAVGAASWMDIYSDAPAETVAFLEQNLDIKVSKVSQAGTGGDYTVIKAKKQFWPFAGIMATPTSQTGEKAQAGTVPYITVKDYDASHAKLIAAGAVPHATYMYIEGMMVGFYMIPGNVGIGIAQYEHVKEPKN